MSDDLRELAALAALGAIEPHDAERLRAALDADPALAAQLALDEETVAALSAAGPAVQTPDLRERLVAAATSTLTPPGPAGRPSRVRRRSSRRLVPAFAALAAVAVAGLVATTLLTRDAETPEVTSTIVSSTGATVQGSVALYRPGTPNARMVVDLATIPASPAGHHYEVWVLRQNASAMESVGTFVPEAGKPVHLEMPLAQATYAAVDISVEENAGPAEHSGSSIAGATLPIG